MPRPLRGEPSPQLQAYKCDFDHSSRRSLQTLCNSSPISMQLIWCTRVYHAKRANKGSPIATRTEGSSLQQEEPQWLHMAVVLSLGPSTLTSLAKTRIMQGLAITVTLLALTPAFAQQNPPATPSADSPTDSGAAVSSARPAPEIANVTVPAGSRYCSCADPANPDPLPPPRRRHLRPNRFARNRRQ